MDFRVLGPLEVEADGRLIDLGRPKQRALLAMLLLDANRVVTADRLVEDLWPAGPPGDPAAALQVQVSRLRHVLARVPAGKGRLERRRTGYVLHVDADELDSTRFERLVAAGRHVLEADPSRPREASALLAQALGLWRGEVLEDFAGEPFVLVEATRLDELRLAAFEDLADAELAGGRHGPMVADLRRMSDAHPLRERLRGQLMVALYRSGRQAEALRAYRDLRASMADELGLLPSPALARLEEMILLQKPELDWEAEPDTVPAPIPAGPARASTPAPALPRPRGVPPGLDADGTPFVGRAAELAALVGAWRRSLAEGPALALVSGEPGIGKSRVALELARAVGEAGAGVLVGRCDEDLAVPYQPFAEAIAYAVRGLGPDVLAQVLGGRRATDLARLLPDLADVVSGLVPELVPGLAPALPSDPETERYRLFEAVGGTLAALCREAPLVVVLDDLHWATTPTLLLLRHLLAKAERMPLLVVGTYRHTEVDDRHPLTRLTDDAACGPITRIALHGLDQDAVEVLLLAACDGPRHGSPEQSALGGWVAGAGGSRRLARSLLAGTAGNALFVREMVRHLAESGPAAVAGVARVAGAAAPGRAGGPGGDGAAAGKEAPPDVPEGVREVVRRRLARLSEEANRLLAVASVIGPDCDVAVLQRAADMDEEVVLSGLEEALRAGLMAEVGGAGLRIRFTHNLVREALYGSLAAARRARAHRRVAEAMEATYGPRPDQLPALAHHFLRGALIGGADKAVTYATLAGGQATAQLAHHEAAEHYRHAVEALEGIPVGPEDPDAAGARARQRCDLLLALGEAQRRSGDPSHRRTLLDAAALAAGVGDGERLASAALANTRSFWSATRQVDAERVLNLEAAEAVLGGEDSPLRARLLAKLAVELVYSGDWSTVRRLSDEALAMARRLGNLETLAAVLGPRYNTIRGDPGTLAERLADTAELLAVASQLPDATLRCEAWGWRGVAALEAADAAEAARCFEVFDRMAADVHQPTMLWYSTYLQAARAMLAGRLDEAASLADEAVRRGRAAGQPDADMFGSVQRLQLAFETGELGRWERPLRVALARDPSSWWFLRSWQALCACHRGDLGQAAGHVGEMAAKGFADLAFEPTWLHILANCSAACHRLASAPDHRRAAQEVAGQLYVLLRPYAGQLVTASSLAYCGAVDHYLGLLAATMREPDEADDHLRAAAEIHRRVDAPLWLSRTLAARSALPAPTLPAPTLPAPTLRAPTLPVPTPATAPAVPAGPTDRVSPS